MEDREEEDERDREQREELGLVEEQLTEEQSVWEQGRTRKKDKERKEKARSLGSIGSRSKKRAEAKEGAPPKRIKHELLGEDWGEAPTTNTRELQPTPPSPPTIAEGSLAMEHSSVEEGAVDHPKPTILVATKGVEEGGGFATTATYLDRVATLTQQSMKTCLAFALAGGRVENLQDSNDSVQSMSDDRLE